MRSLPIRSPSSSPPRTQDRSNRSPSPARPPESGTDVPSADCNPATRPDPLVPVPSENTSTAARFGAASCAARACPACSLVAWSPTDTVARRSSVRSNRATATLTESSSRQSPRISPEVEQPTRQADGNRFLRSVRQTSSSSSRRAPNASTSVDAASRSGRDRSNRRRDTRTSVLPWMRVSAGGRTGPGELRSLPTGHKCAGRIPRRAVSPGVRRAPDRPASRRSGARS